MPDTYYTLLKYLLSLNMERAFLVAQMVKNPPANTGDARDLGSALGLGRSPGEGTDYLLQYTCLENSMDRGAWQTTVHRVAKSRTKQSMHAQCGKRNKFLKLGLFYGKKYLKQKNNRWSPSLFHCLQTEVLCDFWPHEPPRGDERLPLSVLDLTLHHGAWTDTYKNPHSPALSMVSGLISFTLVTFYLLLNFGPWVSILLLNIQNNILLLIESLVYPQILKDKLEL